MEELVEVLIEFVVWIFAEIVGFLFGIWGLLTLLALCVGALIYFS